MQKDHPVVIPSPSIRYRRLKNGHTSKERLKKLKGRFRTQRGRDSDGLIMITEQEDVTFTVFLIINYVGGFTILIKTIQIMLIKLKDKKKHVWPIIIETFINYENKIVQKHNELLEINIEKFYTGYKFSVFYYAKKKTETPILALSLNISVILTFL